MELLVNGKKSPLGLDTTPYLTWRGNFQSTQKAYRILIENDNGEIVYKSKTVFTTESRYIKCDFKLQSSTIYKVFVTVICRNNAEHNLTTTFETGLVQQSDWSAKWISAGAFYRPNWAMYYRKEFDVTKKVKSARLYFSGLGIGVPHLNGQRIGDFRLDPAQSEYTERVYYSVFDITSMLTDGKNCFGAELGDGWFAQNQLMDGGGVYDSPVLRAQILIRFADGTEKTVAGDGSFMCYYSPTVYNNIYIGETYDGRLNLSGWDKVGFDTSGWFSCTETNTKLGKMCWQFLPPMRVCREIKPTDITYPQEGIAVYDFGENLTGTVRLKLCGHPGNKIVMRFAECSDAGGMPDYSSSGVFHIRGVQTLTYVFEKNTATSDSNEIEWTSEFCYFGFRYVEITGAHCTLEKDMLIALKIHTDMEEKTSFRSDMEILNTMEYLFRRTMTNNAQGLPTDCPAREKCGWTGDANIISDSALMLWNSADFWEKYCYDISDCHKAYGIYYNIAPGKRHCLDTVPAWGTAQITIPYRIYMESGDLSVLQRHYNAMVSYGNYLLEKSNNGFYENHQYKLADWAAPYGYESATHFSEISAMYMYYAFDILSKTADLLSDPAECERRRLQAENEKKVITETFYHFKEHTYGSQTLNAFADNLGLIPSGEEEKTALWTENDIIAHEYHITCGHIGTRYIFGYLDKFRKTDTLRKVLESTTYPSFGAQIKAGATTLWECFDLETRFQSLDHPFKGGYCVWLYENVLGIQKLEAGYKRFAIKPSMTLTKRISGYVDTVYGRIEVCLQDNVLSFTVPWNTECEVQIGNETKIFSCGNYSVSFNQ